MTHNVENITVSVHATKKWWVPWLAVFVALFPRHTDWLANFIIDRGVTVEVVNA